jgi:hypothetical protein
MLLLNCARFNTFLMRYQQLAYSPQSAEARMGPVPRLHPAAMARVEHPLRNLQCCRPVQLIPYATKNDHAALSCLAANIHLLAMPWMPRIPYFQDPGFMGVLYPSCTIASGHIARLNTELLVSSASQWAMEMWKAKNASHIPTASTTTTAVRYIHSQNKTEKLRLSVAEKNGAGHLRYMPNNAGQSKLEIRVEGGVHAR